MLCSVLAILGEKFLTGLIGTDLTLQHGFYILVGYGAEVIVFAVDSYGIERRTGMVLVFVDVAHITFLAVDHSPADHLAAFGIVLVEALETGNCRSGGGNGEVLEIVAGFGGVLSKLPGISVCGEELLEFLTFSGESLRWDRVRKWPHRTRKWSRARSASQAAPSSYPGDLPE